MAEREAGEFLAGLAERNMHPLIYPLEILRKRFSSWWNRIQSGSYERERSSSIQLEKKIAKPAAPVLSVRTRRDLEELLEHLSKLEDMKKAAAQINNPSYLKELENIRKRIEAIGSHKKLAELDEESSENAAQMLIDLFPRFAHLMRPCMDKPESLPHVMLLRKIERYLESIGMASIYLEEGMPANDWYELNMKNDSVSEVAPAGCMPDTIGKIYMQPRVIRFVNSLGEIEERHFGGKCLIYVRP